MKKLIGAYTYVSFSGVSQFGKNALRIARKPHVIAFILSVAYLLLLQRRFVITPDMWAESFYEYVHGALVDGRKAFFETGIAGYYNFLPKLISYPYVILGLPLDIIGYLFRASVIIFTVASIAFIAHPYNRWLMPDDKLRISLSILVLMLFSHITIFSMINVWYVGFIPIILVSLSPKPFHSELSALLYAAFSMAVCFSKPSLVLIAPVLFRAWRHKEYLLGFILSFSIGLQTMLFLTSSYYLNQPDVAQVPIAEKVMDMLLYPALILLKTLHIPTPSLGVVIVTTVPLALLCTVVARKIGWKVSCVVGITVALLVYTSLFSPDAPMPSLLHSVDALYVDVSKLQRDILLQVLLLTIVLLGYSHIVNSHMMRDIKSFHTGTFYLLMPLTLAILIYRPIDVTSAGLALNNFQQFRTDLREGTADCMPISPTPLWDLTPGVKTPTYGWYFEKHAYGTCGRSNYIKLIDFDSFVHTISKPQSIDIVLDEPHRMQAIALAVRTSKAKDTPTLRLKNVATHKTYIAKISPRQSDRMAYVVFNVSGESPSKSSHYLLSSDDPTVATGRFTDASLMHYAYYSLLP